MPRGKGVQATTAREVSYFSDDGNVRAYANQMSKPQELLVSQLGS